LQNLLEAIVVTKNQNKLSILTIPKINDVCYFWFYLLRSVSMKIFYSIKRLTR